MYGFNFAYSDFAPIASETAGERAQKALHGRMGTLIDKLYENPQLLGLPQNPDETYEWYMVNNQKPALRGMPSGGQK